MGIECDPLFEAAVNFLENGGELPPIGANARQRFVFQAAVMRKLYQVAKGADGRATDAVNKVAVLEERVNNRTGWIAGTAAIGSAVGAAAVILAKAFGWL